MSEILIYTNHNGERYLRGRFDEATKIFYRPDCPLFIGYTVFIEEDVYNQLLHLGCTQTIIGTRVKEDAKGAVCNPTMVEWGLATRFMWGASADKPLNDRMILFIYWRDVIGNEPVPAGTPPRSIRRIYRPVVKSKKFTKKPKQNTEFGHE